jgi:hypothetical protein
MENNQQSWLGTIVDAYAHIGNPRFGSLKNLESYLSGLSIQQAVIVLGPGLPDYKSIDTVMRKHGDNFRFVGIPFGETLTERREFAEIQIDMGILGMRFMPFEIESSREIVKRIGEQGLCLFAINPYHSTETVKTLIDWLENYPQAKVVCPHFLLTEAIDNRIKDPILFRTLLSHPNFHAILSRHGGVESRKPYPHLDLKPWVEEIVELVTWKRLMWGGEFPIFFERGETIENVRDWILNLGITMSQQEKESFYSNNSKKLLFEEMPLAYKKRQLPDWIEKQQQQLNVKLFTNRSIEIDMNDYDKLLDDYLEVRKSNKQLGFYEYLSEKLSQVAKTLK